VSDIDTMGVEIDGEVERRQLLRGHLGELLGDDGEDVGDEAMGRSDDFIVSECGVRIMIGE
jgi:hypothetical protein